MSSISHPMEPRIRMKKPPAPPPPPADVESDTSTWRKYVSDQIGWLTDATWEMMQFMARYEAREELLSKRNGNGNNGNGNKMKDAVTWGGGAVGAAAILKMVFDFILKMTAH